MMERFAIATIWSASIALPCLIFLVANPFLRKVVTLVRGVFAVLVGWALVVAYAVSAHAINFSLASTAAEHASIYNGDGAALAFAMLFGWVVPLLVVCATWALRNCVVRYRRGTSVA